MGRDIPLLVVTLTIWAYWFRVGAMVVRARRKQHHDVGVIPERPIERVMWLLMVPLVACWCALPTARLDARHRSVRAAGVRARRAVRVDPLDCRRCRGRLPRAYDPVLAPHGPRLAHGHQRPQYFADHRRALRRIRHPIYAFSIVMMIGTAIVLPTPPMLLLAVIHVVLFDVKARNEEAHLARMHGESYARYVQRTGRFFPRPAARNS